MTPENRYTNTIFIDNDLIYSEWGDAKYFLFPWGAMQKEVDDILLIHLPSLAGSIKAVAVKIGCSTSHCYLLKVRALDNCELVVLSYSLSVAKHEIRIIYLITFTFYLVATACAIFSKTEKENHRVSVSCEISNCM